MRTSESRNRLIRRAARQRYVAASPELGTVHARDHHQGRRHLALGVLAKPSVPGVGERQVGAVVVLASVHDQNEQVALGGGRYRRFALVAIPPCFGDVGSGIARRFDPTSLLEPIQHPGCQAQGLDAGPDQVHLAQTGLLDRVDQSRFP